MRGLKQRLELPSAGIWLLAATFVTTVGNGMHTLAIGKLLYDQTGSAAAFGGVIIFEQVVNIVMQLIAGPWVDRGDPKRTCVQVELIRGTFIILAAIMLGVQNPLLWIMLMTMVIRVAQPFSRAASFALAPAVMPAESLERFNGYSNTCLQGGQLLGVALAGVVLQQWSAPAAIVINGITFLFSGLAVAAVQAPALSTPADTAEAPVAQALWKQLLQGWREIGLLLRREPGLTWHLVLSTADAIAVILFNLALVPLVAERYGGSAYWLSMVDGGFAVGAMAAGAVVASISTRWGAWLATLIGIGGQAACFMGLGFTTHMGMTLVLAFGIGTFNTISWTVLTTALQLRVRGPFKGRIAMVRNLLTALIGAALVPLISQAAAVSLNGALGLSGAVCLGYGLIAALLGYSQSARQAMLGQPALAEDQKH